MRIQFWGVRGSIPVPGPETALFGGNTSCVSVRLGGNWVVFDAGTGLYGLGRAMMSESSASPVLPLFLSHVHWDHIQGLPFFAPAFRSGTCLDIHGCAQQFPVLKMQMSVPAFPITMEQMGANFRFHDLPEGSIFPLYDGGDDTRIIGSVASARLNHPDGVLAYRLEEAATGRSVVYATDTEHYGDGRTDSTLVQLARGADLLIYDGMYTSEEYLSHRGWGHSTWQEGFRVASEAGVKRLVLTHHDPSHDDVFLAVYEREMKLQAAQTADGLQMDCAREGMSIDLL